MLIANECLDSRIRSIDLGCPISWILRRPTIMSIGISYLLRRCGFGEKWCSWIMHCISFERFFVLVNDTLSDFISSSRGLR